MILSIQQKRPTTESRHQNEPHPYQTMEGELINMENSSVIVRGSGSPFRSRKHIAVWKSGYHKTAERLPNHPSPTTFPISTKQTISRQDADNQAFTSFAKCSPSDHPSTAQEREQKQGRKYDGSRRQRQLFARGVYLHTAVRHRPHCLNPSLTSPCRRPQVSREHSTAASAPRLMSDKTTLRWPRVLGTFNICWQYHIISGLLGVPAGTRLISSHHTIVR